jgi:inner membrane protein
MLLFAHTGITLGAATLVTGVLNSHKGKLSWFAGLSKYLDVRILIVGSMLPDIIDKPVGQYFFRETFENGRIFSHTLLFLLVLAGAGYYLLKAHRQSWMLVLAAGTAMHLILDQMWRIPETLFWPLMGLKFPMIDLEGWGIGLWEAIKHTPSIYIPELIGLAILIWYGIVALTRKQAGAFFKTGRIS